MLIRLADRFKGTVSFVIGSVVAFVAIYALFVYGAFLHSLDVGPVVGLTGTVAIIGVVLFLVELFTGDKDTAIVDSERAIAQKVFCCNCRHHLPSTEDPGKDDRCAIDPREGEFRTDFVTGRSVLDPLWYGWCEHKNRDGECKDFTALAAVDGKEE